jgi:hypothetical protein
MLALIALMFIIILSNGLRLALKTESKINILAIVFFLLMSIYGGVPVILIEFYHKKAVGVTKGTHTVGKMRFNVVEFQYEINGKIYEGSEGLRAGKNDLIYGGKYYVKYFPLFPSHGYMDFDDPVEKQ